MLDNKVAIVTGAGQGIGRAEALHLAALGAHVVVNDLGVTLHGVAKDEGAAARVAEEIVAAGGSAIAHSGDVANWDSAEDLVQTALNEFGDLNIVVNNAGILRDRTLFNMTEDEWDEVIRVHLKGHFCVSRWATRHWRSQSKERGSAVYGRLVNTSSEVFLTGAPGQPNYAAAKAGIVSLTLSVAQSCHRYGVTANVICPRARTRMTARTIEGFEPRDEDGFDPYEPNNVGPLVSYLASPSAETITGQVFVVWGSEVCVIDAPAPGYRVRAEGRWTPSALDAALGRHLAEVGARGFAMPVST